MTGRPPRAKEIKLRLLAVEGAKKVIADPLLSYSAAGDAVGASDWTVADAFLILTKGTRDEIAALESGKAPLTKLAKAVRARFPEDSRLARKLPAGRPTLQSEQLARIGVFRAARLAIAEGLSLNDAAAKLGVHRRTASAAHVIIQHAPEDIVRRAEAGELSIAAALKMVHDSVPREIRKMSRKRKVINEETRQARDTDIAIFTKVRDAMENIIGLPQPSDVVKIIKKHRGREESVNEKLIAAYAWITEFSDEWTK